MLFCYWITKGLYRCSQALRKWLADIQDPFDFDDD